MSLPRIVFIACCIFEVAAVPCFAQGRNELAFSVGGGSLSVQPGGGATPVFSFSYQLHITSHISAEGALDFFYHKFLTGPPDSQYLFKDDYAGAEAAIVYHFRANRQTGRLLPFVVAGIGKTTTDFTEIAAAPYYRFGIGAGYNLTERWGVRLEIRDEIIKRLYAYGSPSGNLPSIRMGIVYRF